MVRLIIILIFYNLSFAVYSQTFVEGKYIGKFYTSMHGEEFTFKNDGTFEYYEWGDLLPNDYGRGKYEFRDSVLLLNFEDIPEMHDTLLYIENENETKNDTIIYKIKILDFKNKTPDISAVVRLKFSETLKPDTNLYFPDSTGSTVIEFTKNNIPNSFIVSSLGGGKYEYYIPDSMSRNLRIHLKNLNVLLNYIDPKPVQYKIRNIKKDHFELFKHKDWYKYKFYKK